MSFSSKNVQKSLILRVKRMGKHRSRLKILANILDVINSNKGAKKTQIMYQAYLSYKLLVQYLQDVTEAGLVICGKENCYKLTPKGEHFLAKFGEYDKSRESVNEKLNHVEDQRLMLEGMCPNTEVANVDPSNMERNLRRTTEEA
jgi:predicted transcriptional regulator